MAHRWHTAGYAERLRAHCSVADLERWKAAARRAGARNLSEWVRWVLDKETALVEAASRNPWVDRRSGKAKQRELPVQVGHERKQKVLRWHDLGRALAKEAQGL